MGNFYGYGQNPYKPYNGNNAPEYNQNGDSANGRQGSQSPEAVKERAQQQPKSGGNPYAEILNFVRPQQPTSAPPQRQMAPSATENRDTGGGDTGGGGAYVPPQPTQNGKGRIVGPPAPGADHHTINPRTGMPYGMEPPQGVDPTLWNEADRYVGFATKAGANWQALYHNPQWVSDFRNWVGSDPERAKVRIEDYLETTHPELQGMKGQSGSDTYAAYQQAHPQTPPTDPNAPPPNGGQSNIDMINKWRHEHGLPPLTGNEGTAPPAPQPNGPPPTGGPPPDTAPPPPKQDPTNWHDVAYPEVNDGDILGKLLGFYGPANKMAQGDLADQLRSQGAMTGDLNSGAFGDVLGRQEGRLIASQQADLGDKYQTAHENALNRALDRYKTDTGVSTDRYRIDSEKFMSQLQNDTNRYGIKTNADMQKYLGDQATAMQKYGVDSSRLEHEYEAQLRLKGETYSADRAFDAAAMRAAVDKVINENNYNLGIGQLAQNQNFHDNPSFEALMNWYMSMSPEQRAAAGMGNIDWTKFVGNSPNP